MYRHLTIWKNIKLYLIVIFEPKYWLSFGPISQERDTLIINGIIQKEEMTNFSPFTCDFIGVRIWVANYPYAYGMQYPNDWEFPTRRTRILLKEYEQEQRIYRVFDELL